MIVLRAGSMDRVITIQSVTIAIDEVGDTQEMWADVLTTRAQLITSSAKEFMKDFGASSETTCIFRIRWIAGVTLAERISYDGDIYLLKEIAEIGRRRGLELRSVLQP